MVDEEEEARVEEEEAREEEEEELSVFVSVEMTVLEGFLWFFWISVEDSDLKEFREIDFLSTAFSLSPSSPSGLAGGSDGSVGKGRDGGMCEGGEVGGELKGEVRGDTKRGERNELSLGPSSLIDLRSILPYSAYQTKNNH